MSHAPLSFFSPPSSALAVARPAAACPPPAAPLASPASAQTWRTSALAAAVSTPFLGGRGRGSPRLRRSALGLLPAGADDDKEGAAAASAAATAEGEGGQRLGSPGGGGALSLSLAPPPLPYFPRPLRGGVASTAAAGLADAAAAADSRAPRRAFSESLPASARAEPALAVAVQVLRGTGSGRGAPAQCMPASASVPYEVRRCAAPSHVARPRSALTRAARMHAAPIPLGALAAASARPTLLRRRQQRGHDAGRRGSGSVSRREWGRWDPPLVSAPPCPSSPALLPVLLLTSRVCHPP